MRYTMWGYSALLAVWGGDYSIIVNTFLSMEYLYNIPIY